MKNIRLIKQEDDTGCGIACVAMITSKSYNAVKSKLVYLEGWSASRNNYYTTAKQLNKLLNALSIKSKIVYSSSWTDIEGTAIVGVNRDSKGYFHWIITIKDSSRFLIIDPEQGEVYQGSEWADYKGGFIHSRRKSQFISLPIKVTSLKL